MGLVRGKSVSLLFPSPFSSSSCSLHPMSPFTAFGHCHLSQSQVAWIILPSSARNMSSTSKLTPRFAFVDFSSPENQKLAVDLSEKLLEGRKLLIKLGTSYFSRKEGKQGKKSTGQLTNRERPHIQSRSTYTQTSQTKGNRETTPWREFDVVCGELTI